MGSRGAKWSWPDEEDGPGIEEEAWEGQQLDGVPKAPALHSDLLKVIDRDKLDDLKKFLEDAWGVRARRRLPNMGRRSWAAGE